MAYMDYDKGYVYIRHIRIEGTEKTLGVSLNEIKDVLEKKEVKEVLYPFITKMIKENLNITFDMGGEE